MDIDNQVNSLVAGAMSLQAVGKMISRKNLETLKKAYTTLGDLIEAAVKMESSRIVFAAGTIRFEAGERLGTMLQRSRRSQGITCCDVAEAAGISEMAYSEIESGYNSRVPEDILTKICSLLGIDYDTAETAAALDMDMPVRGYGY